MTIELKPCPFCGGEAEISLDHTVEENHAYGCPKCNIWFDTFNSENAEAEWNARAVLEAPPDETVSLRAKLAEVERAAYERGAEAGWNAARTSVYGICEAIEDRANTDLEKPQVSEYGTGYLQAEKSTAKHIRRAMGSFEARDDDNFLALLTQEGR